MPQTPTFPGLHLRYRIWIAEMNADINMLRIFDDHLNDLQAAKDDAQTKTIIETFKNQFEEFKKEMDDLKHEMHLLKMKLAADAKEDKAMDKKLYRADNHSVLQKRYNIFRKQFSKMKTGFELMKYNWIE